MSIDIVESLDSILSNILRALSERDSELQKLAREIVDSGKTLFLTGSRSYELHRVAGIDGSRARVLTIGSASIYLCKAVAVRLDGYRSDRLKIVAIDAALDEDAEGCAEDVMIALETELYGECSECEAVIIDGPIIDPPRPPRRCSSQALDDLHDRRALAIRRVVERGSMVVGVVKRLKGSVLGVPAHLAYHRLCRLVLSIASSRCRAVALPYLGQVAPEDVVEIYRRHGVEMASYVVMDTRLGSVYRADIVPSSSAERALELLSALPVSNDGLPLPVSLAHEASKIPREVLETLRARAKRFLLAYTPYPQ